MRLKSLILLIFLGVLCATCKKDKSLSGNSEPPILSPEKDLLEFVILDSLNSDYINKKIVGEITGTEILIDVPQFVDITSLRASFKTTGVRVQVGANEQISGETANDFSQPLTYTIFAEDGSTQNYTIKVSRASALKTVLPHLYIHTENSATVLKEDYTSATLQIDGKEQFDGYEGAIRIKGRGNDSWRYPKKPYKIKLDTKAPLLGLASKKEWILLAEYMDGSMLYNSIPFTVAHQLNMPYTNHIIPVEVTLNDRYQGVYAFTEQKEVGTDRIDVGDGGLLLELDAYFDDPWKFRSSKYQLPVMVEFPEEDEMDNNKLNEIMTDFQSFENLVFDESFPDNDYLNLFDDQAFINYMLVYVLTGNEEINHPKSVYMNKKAGGKYRMGIIWDFDWAFGFQSENRHYILQSANNNLFWDGALGDKPGTKFFSRLMSDPHMKSIFKKRWNWFKTDKFEELKQYVIDYSGLIREALQQDHAVWGKRDSSGDAGQDLQKALDWLDARSNYIDSYVAGW